MKSDLLIIKDEGVVRHIVLNRAEKRNALNDGLIASLDHAFSNIPETTKAIVLSGEGEHFSAGLDLSELTERNAMEAIQHSRNWHRVFEKIQFAPCPVVAALKGAVIGGGLELAAACHIRVADQTAYYALPEGQRGIFVGGGGSMRLPRLVGTSMMTDMMLTGRIVTASEGLTYHFSNYLVDKGQELERAFTLAKKIAGNATMTNFAVLQVLPHISENNPQSALLMESMIASLCSTHEEAQQRLRDFLNKKAAKIQ